tara:strand:- start:19282 stop:20832 length:1551 start_codon:yes stop_codon:yes gene_type:complete
MAEEYEEDYDYEEDKEEDPQWRLLTPKERKKLLKNAFTNDDWYEDGSLPVHKGGDGNPLFEVLSDRVGAPLSEIKRYYAAWLNSQGFSAENALKKAPSNNVNPSETLGQYMIKDEPVSNPQHQQQNMGGMGISDPGLMPPPPGGNSDSMGMWAMMNFLTSQQRMAMQQQQFQMMQNMEQRKLDQNREESQRREAMARDQQFMNQQMSFMREMIKKSGDGDGFFDSDMKKIMKEKVVDQMLGGGNDGDWKDMVKDVIGSDTMKAAVGGIGSAIGSRNSTPAGYNVPGYNPYAQPIPQQPEQVMHNPAIPEQQVSYEPQPQPVEQPPSGYFGEENEQPQAVEMQEVPREPSADEYQQALMSTLSQLMGPSLQDPKNLEAVKQQVEVAVETTLVENPELLPQMKLIKMTEKILLILNLRDIGLGLKDLLSKTKPGQPPSNLILAVVVEQLRDRPEFYKIFAENTYEELVATIEPFKNTGTISYDYEYLLNPDVAEVCRYMLAAVSEDARQKGAPPVEGM